MLKKFTTCAFIVTLISSVLIGTNIIFANDKGEDIQAKPPTLEIMVKQASKDPTLLETLNQFSDQDTIIAYPENMGGLSLCATTLDCGQQQLVCWLRSKYDKLKLSPS